MKYNKLIPELSVTNINKSKEFYTNLGFKIKYERKETNFCFLELQNNQIMIEQINNNWETGTLEYPFGRGINISMTVKDINLIYQNAIDNQYKIFKEIMINKYRVEEKIIEEHEFLIQDPDGYLLRFND
ncbi:MAG: VOC family protein [Bacilli bacterium]|nr:VOC family protein [Bacilli bacterium]